jgi:formyl-CoA transferase
MQGFPDVAELAATQRAAAAPGSVRWTGPAPGAHNDEVLGGILGLGERELRALRAAKVI